MKKIRGYVLAVIGIVIIWVIFGKRIQEMMDNVRMPRIGNIMQSQPTTPRQTPSPITPTIQPPFYRFSPPASTTVTPTTPRQTPSPITPTIQPPPASTTVTPTTPRQTPSPITPTIQPPPASTTVTPTTPRQTPSPITPTIQPPPASTTVTPSHDPFSPTPTNPFIPAPQPFVPIHTPLTTSMIVDSINPVTGGEVFTPIFTPIMWASTTSGMGGTQPSVGGGTGLAEIAW